MTNCVLIVQLEILQIPHNLFSPSAQIIWDMFEKSLHHLSIANGLEDIGKGSNFLYSPS